MRWKNATPGKACNSSTRKKCGTGFIVTYDFPPWLNYIICEKCGEKDSDYGSQKCTRCGICDHVRDHATKLSLRWEEKVINTILGDNMPRFKVGDEVRVKATPPTIARQDMQLCVTVVRLTETF